MNFTAQIDGNFDIPNELWDSAIASVETAMAHRFATIANHNFGFNGEDRPTPWPALSSKYAKEFHDGNRIPKLILSGDLQRSIKIKESNGDGAEVYTDNEYAVDHQYGVPEINLPARPFFSIVGNSLTPYAEAQCLNAANNALVRALNN